MFDICYCIVHWVLYLCNDEVKNDNELKKIKVSESTVIIESNGASKFVDVFAEYTDGTIVKINENAIWETSDQDVALAYDGRIIAVDKGSATITVKYGMFKEDIEVNVLEKRNLEDLLYLGNDQRLMANDDRDIIMYKASDMYNCYWTPSVNDIRGWRNNFTFKVGNTYHLPYSQTAYQVDDIGFISAFVNYQSSGFYNNYSRVINGESIIMPKYGNDCSGFVSFCLGISRHTTTSFLDGIDSGDFNKVGNYDVDSPSYNDLINSYPSLQRGDAVVTEGHTFLIGAAYDDYVICYEQTPFYLQITVWDHEDLANNSYRPFSIL